MSLPELSIKRPVFVSMVTLALVVLGAMSLSRLPVELYPDITFPVLAVRTELPGAAPEEVESLVTVPVEDVLSTVADVKSLRSISREGNSIVVLEFSQSADIKYQETQVRAKVASIQNRLPEAAATPTVFRTDPDDTPIIELVLQGERQASELTDLAEDIIARRLRQLSGVGEVNLSGEARREVHIDLRPLDLATYALSGSDVVAAIKRNNRNEPVGRVEGSERRWIVRLAGQVSNLHELAKLPVGNTKSGQAIFLAQVADLRIGYADATSLSRSGDASGLRPAILIDVTKQSGENAVAISDRVQAAVQDIQMQLPADVTLRAARDNANLIRSNVADVYESLAIAVLLTVFVVLIFLRSPRSTLTTGLAIPSSIITAFIGVALAGFSVNVMTLLALSLSIGLVVDDAIVVRENIFRHLAEESHKASVNGGKLGRGALAALAGTKEVTLAVVATTATVIAVFMPVGFMEGVTGQFFKPFALTVVFAMAVSLWDALTMAPMLSAYFANIPDPAKEWNIFGPAGRWVLRVLDRVEHGFVWLAQGYSRMLAITMRKNLLAAMIGLAILAASAWGFRTIDKSFLPPQLGDTFSVFLEGPLATPVAAMAGPSQMVHAGLTRVSELDYWTLSSRSGFGGGAQIRVTAHIKPEAARSQKSLAAARERTRRELGSIPGFSVRIAEPSDPLSSGAGRFQPIVVTVSGLDLKTLKQEAARLRSVMVATPGISDVGTLEEDGLPEVLLRINRERAAYYGLTAENIAQDLNVLIQGNTSNQVTWGDDALTVRIRAKQAASINPRDLLVMDLRVRSATTGRIINVPLSNVVDVSATAGPTVINRENRIRSLRIGARTEPGRALGPVIRDLEGALAKTPLAAGVTARVTGQSEQMRELFGNLVWALGLGGLFVFMVLASLFESFLLPLVVMTAIPMAAVGAVAALLVTGLPLDLYGGIGLVLLAGIVAKNSILLVDFAVARVRAGHAPHTALAESAPLRLRPILMTSAAMAAGMLPVALGLGSGGAARQSLGVAAIGGVISSTLLTLIIVPNFFLIAEALSARFKARRASRASSD